MTSQDIQDLIDKHLQGIFNPWIGSVPFPLYKWDKIIGEVESIFLNGPTHLRIASCLNGQSKPTEQSSDESFTGFTHREIVVQWTSAYMHLAYKTSTPQIIQQFIKALATNDIKGSQIVIENISCLASKNRIKNDTILEHLNFLIELPQLYRTHVMQLAIE